MPSGPDPAIDYVPAGPDRAGEVRDLLMAYGREILDDHGYPFPVYREGEDPLRPFKGDGGCFLLACRGTEVLAGGGIRAFPGIPGSAEIKRVYVRPAARGLGLGRGVTVALIDHARTSGFDRVLLDTLGTLHSAQALYDSLGFQPIEAYHDDGIVPGMKYFEMVI